MTLQAVLQSMPLDQIGASHGKYLNFEAKSKKWSVVNLNCLERFIRWLGLAYGSTTLKHVATHLAREDVTNCTDVLVKVQASWNRTYPQVRSPLKLSPYTKLDPNSLKLDRNIATEGVIVGNSKYFFCQEHRLADESFAILNMDPFAMQISLLDSTEETLDQDVRRSLRWGLENRNGNGDEVQVSSGTFGIFLGQQCLQDNPSLQKKMAATLSTIESFLYKQSQAGTPRTCVFRFDSSADDVKNLAETIKICREMKHPHGQII